MQESTFLEDNDRVKSLLRSMDKLSPFSDADLQSFLNLAKLRKFEVGEYIIKEGEYDCWVYFLLDGEVEVLKQNKQMKIFSQTGDIFGEMCVLDGEPRSASIRAATTTLLLGVDGTLMDQKKEARDLTFCYALYRLFAEVLAEKLRTTTEENILLQKKLQQYEGKP